MKLGTCAPRPDWRARVEAQGCLFHSAADTGVYWGEGAYYELTEAEADAIEVATREVHAMCLAAVEHVIARGRWAELGIGLLGAELATHAWRSGAPALYGRMDFAFGDGVPRLLEYNADTPTSLLEAGVIQWTWLHDVMPGCDQFSRVHEALIAAWRGFGPRVHFACVPDLEDEMTVGYLRDTAQQAGIETIGLAIGDIGWDSARGALVGLRGEPIATLFKLYPWEGLVADPLAPVISAASTVWLEPAWKMILSNKAILPVLWELFPDHPNLLPAAHAPIGDAWVRKPRLGREGSNVTIHAPGVDVATPGPYDATGHIYQAYASLGCFDGRHPVIGSWIVGDRPAGLGIRDSADLVTNNFARFVPHVIR